MAASNAGPLHQRSLTIRMVGGCVEVRYGDTLFRQLPATPQALWLLLSEWEANPRGVLAREREPKTAPWRPVALRESSDEWLRRNRAPAPSVEDLLKEIDL